ncbi:hypothetical protein [Negativibacillus massiliensis]|uniref:hypothetical protein n=1 Tax=Negativibacillus massiliensis TaxID=1871035 RepID=UPI003AF273F5
MIGGLTNLSKKEEMTNNDIFEMVDVFRGFLHFFELIVYQNSGKKNGTYFRKKIFSNNEFAEVSREFHEVGYLIDLHDKVEKLQKQVTVNK